MLVGGDGEAEGAEAECRLAAGREAAATTAKQAADTAAAAEKAAKTTTRAAVAAVLAAVLAAERAAEGFTHDLLEQAFGVEHRAFLVVARTVRRIMPKPG